MKKADNVQPINPIGGIDPIPAGKDLRLNKYRINYNS